MATAKKNAFEDTRLTKDAGVAARGSRDSADSDRVHNDGQGLTEAERRQMLRKDWVQEVLPTPPAVAGWHFCWLSTTNSTDPIYRRQQLGYVPVTSAEVPSFGAQYAIKGGEFDGCISCNEMLLFKLPMERYQDLMAIYHHDMPMEQESAIRDNVNSRGVTDSSGRQLAEVEGDFQKLGRADTRAPNFI